MVQFNENGESNLHEILKEYGFYNPHTLVNAEGLQLTDLLKQLGFIEFKLMIKKRPYQKENKIRSVFVLRDVFIYCYHHADTYTFTFKDKLIAILTEIGNEVFIEYVTALDKALNAELKINWNSKL
jgi:hypothetical protein